MIYRDYYIEELIHVWNVYTNYDAWRDMKPILHTATSLDAAKKWIDDYLGMADIPRLRTQDSEGFAEAVRKLPFMPERGEPLPEAVARELYPSAVIDLMEVPVSAYGRVVAEETAKLLKDFMLAGSFVLSEKFDETGWSSDSIMYTGQLAHLPTRSTYLVDIGVIFKWREPESIEQRVITLFTQLESPEEVWDGELSAEGGRKANEALSKQRC